MATNVNVLDRVPTVAIRALRTVLAPFEDPIGTARPLWRDYSRYQGQIDFAVAAANGVLGCASRATISWGYQDPWFPRNWSEPAKYGMYRTSYHVLYPGEDVLRQADNWYKVHPEIDVIPRAIDLELQHDVPYGKIAEAVWNLSNIVLQRDGVRPLIYSRYLLINSWLASWTPEMLNEHWWWLAQFLWDRTREHAGPPTMPERIETNRVLLHQTADKKAGFPGEVESASVDHDRWELGDAADMHEWIAETWGDGVPEPPLPGDWQAMLADVQAQVDLLKKDNEMLFENVQLLNEDTTALFYRVEELEKLHETPDDIREFIVTSDKTLACKSVGKNTSGYPIIAENFYEPRIRWDHGDTIVGSMNTIRADGSSYWHVLQPGQNGKNMVPASPTLYVNANDVALQ